ncbi:hypothetical protein JW960_24955 [candidate division KSB1 bacterium]|nr:hypothetical protein [candidate division KSB1 bacterium]
MVTLRRTAIFILILILKTSTGHGSVANWTGQLSSWATISEQEPRQTYLGLRYMPGLFSEKQWSTNSLSFEGTFNLFGVSQITSLKSTNSNWDDKLYRLWLRFAGNQYEMRIGLQKINFGSASILRPLMWFDQIDPRDPLQITDGVWAALFRYYFLNNTNVWLWSLYSSDGTKGWEIFPSNKHSAEFGGRVQVPVWRGEMALSYHHRIMDVEKWLVDQVPPFVYHLIPKDDFQIPEQRLGVDGKWDVGIGIWSEAVWSYQRSDWFPFTWQRWLNIGMDYTFEIGNGLNVMTELFKFEAMDKPFEQGEGTTLSSLSVNYPLGIIDQLMGIFYYDHNEHNFYRIVNWKRTYDHWSCFLIGFWNPVKYAIYQNQNNQLYSGKGIQLMLVFNH